MLPGNAKSLTVKSAEDLAQTVALVQTIANAKDFNKNLKDLTKKLKDLEEQEEKNEKLKKQSDDLLKKARALETKNEKRSYELAKQVAAFEREYEDYQALLYKFEDECSNFKAERAALKKELHDEKEMLLNMKRQADSALEDAQRLHAKALEMKAEYEDKINKLKGLVS